MEVKWPCYLGSTAGLAEGTRVVYEAAWRLRVQPWFGTVPARRIRANHVEDWLADLNEG